MGLCGFSSARSVLFLMQRQKIHRHFLVKLPGVSGQVRWRGTCGPVPVLTATPTRALVDEPVKLKGYHLPPNSPVTMRARMMSEDGDLWQSMSHYHSDENGVVDLTKHSSVGGSYVGCEPMGLFWSLQPQQKPLRLRKLNVETPFTVNVSMLEGHVSPANPSENQQTTGERELAAVSLQRWYMAPGVRRIVIRQNQVVGTLFLPPGPGPFPALLDLWGLGRGLVEYRAALLASRSFACMTLAYFDHEDLPGPPKRINVGDSYMKAAWQLLKDHPQVCEDRIAIMGISFGVLVALRIATYPSVHPRCVVCINGPIGSISKIFNEDGENADGEQTHWGFNDQGLSFQEVSKPCNVPPENFVQVENLRCPVMFIVGEDDLSCASEENADEVERRLGAVGKSHLVTLVSYPGAGHLIECPYTPTSRSSIFSNRPTPMMIVWGGNLAQHAVAQEDSWRRILAFLEQHLREEGRT
ncbi:bile acid-CoA:amino acid N-acyltransferase-like [Trichomycterus rosablanca]|uniref:bile acid-CoA:amino acid N-acyltransferase-like n=1 Tax=Trichomycterus rosablanca TaxID=2290929 RepID=UPI002F35F971